MGKRKIVPIHWLILIVTLDFIVVFARVVQQMYISTIAVLFVQRSSQTSLLYSVNPWLQIAMHGFLLRLLI